MAFPPTRAAGPFRPTRLGQWEVIAKIAGGGMSAVYLGRRVEPAPHETPDLGGRGSAEGGTRDVPNVVALKIVRHDVRMDETMLRMFLEEGKLIARLVHPNIVRTLEVGGDAEQDFIAMELMLGKTFAAIHDAVAARDVRLNPEIAAWAAARVADALHYAHELADEAGHPLALVHRDVNPANVFATFDGQVKLFDFGLAKVTAGELKGSNVVAGKLSYLSPEQIMQMPLDRRSDIFSLGITLWELLTGRRLFRRDSDLETVRAVQLGPIPDPRMVAPEIPEELARIAKTALERNREHRYPTAAHLARELDAFIFTRTSPNDVTARLSQLVDTLFPGEQKRQHGWLKPAVGGRAGSGPASSNPGPVSARAWAGRPTPPPRSITPREITQVMPNAPARPSDPGVTPSSMPAVPAAAPVPHAAASAPAMPTPAPSAPPSSPRRPFSDVPSAEDTQLDLSAPAITPRDGTPVPAASTAPMSSSPRAPGWLGSGKPAPGAPPAPERRRGLERSPLVRPPLGEPIPNPRRSGVPVPPPTPTESAPPPSSGSRTDIQAIPEALVRKPAPAPAPMPAASRFPVPASRAPAPVPASRAPAPPAPSTIPTVPKPLESSSPSLVPSGPGFVRPKRVPVPLPSRIKTDVKGTGPHKPVTTITEPPPSDTQVDMPAPPGMGKKPR